MKKLLLAFILICSFILRIYKGPELYFWNVDEDIIGLTVKRMLIDLHPQLIGFPIPGGIYLGPLFYYIISVFYLISFFDPQKFYIFSALMAALTTYLVYIVGAAIFEKKSIGLLAAVIYAFSYFSNVYGRLLTGLSFAPILSLLTYWILYQNIKFKKPKFILTLGIVLLIASQNEGASLSLLVLTILSFLIFRLKIPFRKFVQIAALFTIFHIPLLIFDLRHNFYITRSFLAFFSFEGNWAGQSITLSSIINVLEIFPLTLSRIIYPTGNLSTSDQILPCPDLIAHRIFSIPPVVFISAAVILGIFLINISFRKKKTIGESLIALHFLTALGGIAAFNIFLNGYLFEWILVIFLPAFCLISAYSFVYLYEKNVILRILVMILLLGFLFFNIKAVLNSSDNFGLAAKKKTVKAALELVGDRDFHLEGIGSCYQTGYMYLFWQAGRMPTSSWMDDMFSPTYYPRAQKTVDTKIIISVPSKNEGKQFFEKYNYYKHNASNSVQIGAIEVLVVEDSK